MDGKELVLRLEKGRAYLTDSKFFRIQDIYFRGEKLYFNEPCFVKAKVIHYDGSSILAYDVSYGLGIGIISDTQLEIHESLNSLKIFRFKMDSNYEALFNTIPKHVIYHNSLLKEKQTNVTRSKHLLYHNFPVKEEQENVSEWKTIGVSIQFKNLTFVNEAIQFGAYIKNYGWSEFSVPNKYIIKEYNPLNKYFSKVLGMKKVSVLIKYRTDKKKIVEKIAESEDLFMIDDSVVINVKANFSQWLGKGKSPNGEKIMTLDELARLEDVNVDKLFDNEEALFDNIINSSNYKHKDYIAYLSKKHKFQKHKIHRLFEPTSYLILVEGKKRYFFVWETLDSKEATYIWACDGKKDGIITCEQKKVMKELDLISLEGKKAYLEKAPLNFMRIEHDYKNKESGFALWRDKFETYILNY